MGKKKSHFSNKLGNHPLKAQSLDYRWHILRLLKHMANKKKKKEKRGDGGRGKVVTACGLQELYLLPPQLLLALASWRPSARHSLFSPGISCTPLTPVQILAATAMVGKHRPWAASLTKGLGLSNPFHHKVTSVETRPRLSAHSK